MKTLKLSMAMSLGVLLMLSCTKEKVVEPSLPENTNVQKIQQDDDFDPVADKTKGTNDKNETIWRQLFHNPIRCEGSNGNCLDDAVVTSANAIPYSDFLQAVEGDAQDVGNYFNGESWEDIFDYIPSAEVDDLQSGEYDLVEFEGDGQYTRYFFAGTGTVSPDYFEFIITIDESKL